MAAKMYPWMICKLLEPILTFIEHDYHTTYDADGYKWRLVDAIRDYMTLYKDTDDNENPL